MDIDKKNLPDSGLNDLIWFDTQTKLDLADAWLELGDLQAVSDLLREIMRDGDDVQKLRAESIWTQMDLVRLGLK